jgi:tRNA threonylcarbamoyladenosine modification (KEOPS) complex Cgi121 subunit
MENGPQDVLIFEASSDSDADSLIKIAAKASNGKDFVQLFDYDAVINITHLLGAYVDATSTLKSGSAISKTARMEFLLFAAMTRQINEAIKTIGIKNQKRFVVFSTSKKSYAGIARLLKSVKKFNPDDIHVKNAAARYGIKYNGEIDAAVLQRMAISRLS